MDGAHQLIMVVYCFFCLHILIKHQLYCGKYGFFEHQDGFSTHFACLKLSSWKGVRWWTYLTPTGFSVRKSQNEWKTRSERLKKPILRKGTHAISTHLGTRTCPGPDFSTTNNQIPAMRGVPDQTFGACRVVSTLSDGNMLEMTNFKNTPPTNLYQKRAPSISYQDEKRVLDMKPPSCQISWFLFLTQQKIIGNINSKP